MLGAVISALLRGIDAMTPAGWLRAAVWQLVTWYWLWLCKTEIVNVCSIYSSVPCLTGPCGGGHGYGDACNRGM